MLNKVAVELLKREVCGEWFLAIHQLCIISIYVQY